MQVILVPQGSEYKAVCRGLSRITPTKPLVLPIPVGPEPLARHLEKLQQAGHFRCYPQPRVLLMGLCGSLSPHYAIGDIVLYQECVYESIASTQELQSSDRELTSLLHQKLKTICMQSSQLIEGGPPCPPLSLVRALTSDRLIWEADEKRTLGQIYDAGVVDMEGFAALKVLGEAGIAVAMVRVVSDDCYHNLPDLTQAISPDGSLQTLPLTLGLLRHPIAAAGLIRGALRGLQVLQRVTTFLCSGY